MNTLKDGALVSLISFPGDSVDGGEVIKECDGTGRTLHYQEENFGDHGIGWVIETMNGVERARHNVRFLETIVWHPQPPSPAEQEGK